jgi:hypothetical protein
VAEAAAAAVSAASAAVTAATNHDDDDDGRGPPYVMAGAAPAATWGAPAGKGEPWPVLLLVLLCTHGIVRLRCAVLLVVHVALTVLEWWHALVHLVQVLGLIEAADLVRGGEATHCCNHKSMHTLPAPYTHDR